MSFRIQDGTPKSGKSLCLSCRYAHIVRGQNREEIMTCSANMFGSNISAGGNAQMYYTSFIPGQITFKVEQCTGYLDARTPSLEEMRKIAWDVTARKRGLTGFSGGVDPNELETVITPPKKDGVVWKETQLEEKKNA